MAEAEDVIADVARHATVYARALWKRHRRKATLAGLALGDVSERLDLVITGVFGQSLRLRVAEPPAPPNFLRTLLRRVDGPQAAIALPGTDAASIWLPPRLLAAATLTALERYKLMSLQQAMRVRRGLPQRTLQLADGVERDVLQVLEADASDAALLQLLPGLRQLLSRARAAALASRPGLHLFPRSRLPLEQLLRLQLSTAPVDDPATPAALQEMVGVLSAALVAQGNTRQRSLLLDEWTGEVLAPGSVPAPGGFADTGEPAVTEQRSHRLPRSPRIRAAKEGEDNDKKQGAWMVQTTAPHEQVEDPVGLQRPTDRGLDVAAEELADALSELPQARLVSTAARTREVFLSEEHLAGTSASTPGQRAAPAACVVRFPEWDHRIQAYRPDFVTVHIAVGEQGPPEWVDRIAEQHGATIQQMRRRFEALRAERSTRFRQLDGDDVDIEAFVEARADFLAGRPLSQALYLAHQRVKRDLALFLLADISGSTDSWVSQNRRIVDVEREALLLFCRSVRSLGAPCAVGAFSGEGPSHVSMRMIKSHHEPFSAITDRRIAGLEPQHYTRAGAAIRYATSSLMTQTAEHRLLLLLSDGKPNDVDAYEGRYGVEDMRQAAVEAKLQGINLFCLTVDRQAAGYLPAVFGPRQYALLSRPELLPVALVDWLQRLLRA